MKRRNRLYKKYKSSGSQTALKNYKYTRNKITSELRKAKQGFFNKMNNANSKSFWKLYKTILNKTENQHSMFEEPHSWPSHR